MLRTVTFIIILTSCCLYGQNRMHQKETLIETDRLLSHFNEKQGLGKALLQFVDEDCILLPEFGHPIQGKERIGELLNQRPDLLRMILPVWKIIFSDIAQSGELGYTFGRYALTDPDSIEYDKMKYQYYVSVWMYRVNAWKLVFLLGLLPFQIEGKTSAWIYQQNGADAASTIEQHDRSFASISKSHGYAEAFYQFMADDGLTLGSGGRPPRNKEYYRRLIIQQKEKGISQNFQLFWEPEFSILAESGELGLTHGFSEWTLQNASGEDQKGWGYYLSIWKKQQDGRWKFVLDGGNASPPRNP